MTMIALREPVLVEQVHQVAEREGLDVAALVAEAVRHYLATWRQKRIMVETEAWYRLPVEDRKQYEGRFVAVYGGRVIDSDPGRLTLYLRLREQYGRRPILITEGGDHPIPVYRVRSPWRVKADGADGI